MPERANALTLSDVLAEAMECIVTDGGGADLAEVRFGQFSDFGAGWYWIAVFKTEKGSHPSVAKRTPQPLRTRIRMVLGAWQDEYARYMTGPEEDK